MRAVDLFGDEDVAGWRKFVARFKRRVTEASTGCHVWTGERNERGYGRLVIERDGKRHRFYAHRVAWEIAGRELRESFDHLCRNTSCVNPDHLEPCSRQENTRRQNRDLHGAVGERCRNGHVGEHRTDPKSGKRYCKACSRENARRYYHASC